MRTTSFEGLWKVAEIRPAICFQTPPSKSCGELWRGVRFCHENKITATWLTHHKAPEKKSVRQAPAFASTLNGSDKKYHNIQEVIYSETHPSGLPSYFSYFDCQRAQICVQQRFHFTSKPAYRC